MAGGEFLHPGSRGVSSAGEATIAPMPARPPCCDVAHGRWRALSPRSSQADYGRVTVCQKAGC